MKIVIAPDSYKESLSALEVATAIEQGFREIFPAADFVKLPVADGGEGTVEAMVAATQGRIVHASVSGPWTGSMASPVTNRARLLKWRRQAVWSSSRLRNAIPFLPPPGGPASLSGTRWMRALSILLLVLAAVPPMTAVPAWCRHWG